MGVSKKLLEKVDNIIRYSILIWPVGSLLIGGCACGDRTSNTDPARCQTMDLGDAPTLVESGTIKNDQMVFVQGIADPRALVWLDRSSQTTYYITKILGTQQRLFYLRQLKPDEKPTIKSEFRGHLLRWDLLPEAQSASFANALAEQYNIHISPATTYLINATGKPKGCP